MESASMTAKMSLFARAFHAKTYEVKIFDDSVAGTLLGEEEYRQIAGYLTAGVSFFLPGFQGSEEEALRRIVGRQLAPSPLGRAAFAEEALRTAAAGGVGQYLILGAGYDSFAYRRPPWAEGLRVFELDLPATAEEKRARLARAGIAEPEGLFRIPADLTQPQWQTALLGHGAFDAGQRSFCSLLGLVYYLPETAFEALLETLNALLPPGSAIAFDYPDAVSRTDGAAARAKRQSQLAAGAGETMQAGYSLRGMERLLAAHGFRPAEHLMPDEITARYFARFNRAYPQEAMRALENVHYCLAVKEGRT
ncbi:MAG: class I SAM-dependent methyltransferase [Oscillospiraceae bacterium]